MDPGHNRHVQTSGELVFFTAARELDSTTGIMEWYIVYNDYYTYMNIIIKIVLRLY